jgi:hypothetical protein
MNIQIQVFDGKVIGVEMPNFVELTITECEPGVKGDTATAGTKPATLETGAQVKVPFFKMKAIKSVSIPEPVNIYLVYKDNRKGHRLYGGLSKPTLRGGKLCLGV